MIIKGTKYYCALLAVGMMIAADACAQEAGHSLLSNGLWWKASIAESGVYRVSGAEVNNMTGTPTADIAVYGYDGGAMPTTHRTVLFSMPRGLLAGNTTHRCCVSPTLPIPIAPRILFS